MRYRFTFHIDGRVEVRRPARHEQQVRSIGAVVMRDLIDPDGLFNAVSAVIDEADNHVKDWQNAASKRSTEAPQ